MEAHHAQTDLLQKYQAVPKLKSRLLWFTHKII
ncbi:hypothetical protein KJW53_03245 [Streptococcus macedonicus]|nr:hypothetical protein [Streptococcus macedonicus]